MLCIYPGEPFIEYQLFAQAESSDKFVCVAGYGDGGMGYLGMRDQSNRADMNQPCRLFQRIQKAASKKQLQKFYPLTPTEKTGKKIDMAGSYKATMDCCDHIQKY